MRLQLTDLNNVTTDNAEYSPLHIDVLKLLIAICCLVHTILSYLCRDGMLTASNYYYSKNYAAIELIDRIEEESNNRLCDIFNCFSLCRSCTIALISNESLKIEVIEKDYCSSCGIYIMIPNICPIDNWFESSVNLRGTAIN